MTIKKTKHLMGGSKNRNIIENVHVDNFGGDYAIKISVVRFCLVCFICYHQT